MRLPTDCFCLLLIVSLSQWAAAEERPRSFSGIYPHLAMFNGQGECGTGAVVPWAGKLWVVTYAPHQPRGSDDKLYEISPELELTIRPESIGGTPANRMIHAESGQLFIGPYAINELGHVRTIPFTTMFGRPTGNARHLTDPQNFLYCASMEEALYEINVHSLEVNKLFSDEADPKGRHAKLPGYHGKGLSSGYGRVIYSNNGEHGKLAQERPDIPSGVLATWDGQSSQWDIVARTQFTEVTTPDGIYGNLHPDTNPVWAVGWDHRSLILMCLFENQWHRYRQTKASHSYDGAHGWNTEWPRIREIGEDDLLMTMHGAFWKFPKDFRPGHTGGIRPRSSYLKIVGDFCRWDDQIVLGCDDSAKAEFLNTRKAKGKLAGPAQSQSNLAFLAPEELDSFGEVRSHGSIWINDLTEANVPSDAMHVGGFAQASLFLAHDQPHSVAFEIEADATGQGQWSSRGRLNIAPGHGELHSISLLGCEWLRITSAASCVATASFELRPEHQPRTPAVALTKSLAQTSEGAFRGGLVRAGLADVGLQMLATRHENGQSTTVGYYELTPDLKFIRSSDQKKSSFMKTQVGLKSDVVTIDGHSVLYVDDDGERYRLPIGNPWFLEHPSAVNDQRIAREVCTERDLFQAAGTFFELPARNAGGFRKLRPVSTNDQFIHDYCSWRGLMVLTGLSPDANSDDPNANDPHVIVSDDREAAVWLGSIDDLWKFGAPRGQGGPWTNAVIEAGETSDPYLYNSYGRKTLKAEASTQTTLAVECDLQGNGIWTPVGQLALSPDLRQQPHQLRLSGAEMPISSNDQGTLLLPDALNAAYWIRFQAQNPATVSLLLTYEP